ncbi:hypothetical protein MLD38_009579 [Melastoma candidum]|uniref:Uncharacterized protein n=1 Tax=Melastoma candidum TaxID=119954 RepID=A0ACB9S1P5_9MYRT|nr:hypothetical protein MLD38_009579 [Melastoma candidum]
MPILEVSFGWGHALARTDDGKLFGWGYLADGRIGTIAGKAECSPLEKSENVSRDGSPEEVSEKLVLEAMEKEKDMPILWEPWLLEELSGMKVRNIACGLDHSLLGRTGPQHILEFIEELSDKNPVLASGGRAYSVGLVAKKEVWVWGSSRNGRLGTGSSWDEAEPVPLDNLEGVEVSRAGCGLDHTLLLVSE